MFLDETYSVNQGGCCFLASIIAMHLDKLNIEYDLVVYDGVMKDRKYIEYEVINCRKRKNPIQSVTGSYACNHYCLQIKGAGFVNSSDEGHRYIIPNVTYKNIRWIYKNSNWNECYEVRHNKTIKNIVNEFFKEYERSIIS